MALSLLINAKDPITIEQLEIEVTFREVHTYTNQISTSPVEDGGDITDNVKQTPPKLLLEGITSNTPVDFFGQAFSNFVRGDNSNRAQLVFNTLTRYAGYLPSKQAGDVLQRSTNPIPVTVVTGLKVYSNMMVARIVFHRETSTGDALEYTVELQKMKKVNSLLAFVNTASNLKGKAPNARSQAAKTINVGKVQTKPESLLSKGVTAGAKVIGNILGGN